MMKEGFITYWQARLQRDLAAFADPGTLVVSPGQAAIDSKWESRGKEMSAHFSISLDTGVRVMFQERTLSYRAFLSTPEMADLLGLAKMRLRFPQSKIFIETKGRKLDGDASRPESAIDLLKRESEESNDTGRTKILMVTGDAGSGKTQVLTELVRRKAEEFVSGKSDCLYLYINAQGRALARLYEAIATELQDLRSLVTYHAIPALVHAGALVLVVDGFDELLGVGGYDDAFSSLASFIGELDGEGRIIASARSAYYEQEFLQRAGTAASLGQQSWMQVPIKVENWGEDELSAYATKYCQAGGMDDVRTQELVASARRALSGANSALLGKPLFIAKTLELLATVPDFAFKGNDLLKSLVEGYLERERCAKLLDKSSKPLLTHDQMSSLMVALADEMWNQETRELDSRSVKEIADFQLELLGVDSAARIITTERMPFLAFMTKGSRSGQVAYEHEMFFSYFLAAALSKRLISKDIGFELFLGRSILPSEVSDTASRILIEEKRLSDNAALQGMLAYVGSAAIQRNSRSEQIKENAGTLVLALFNTLHDSGWTELKNAEIRGITFPGGSMERLEFNSCNFSNVIFRRVDLSLARFINCSAHDVSFYEPTVDPKSTRLQFVNFDPASVYGIRWHHDDRLEVVYDPDQLLDVLSKCGAVEKAKTAGETARKIDPHLLDMIQRLLRAYNRANPLCVADWQLKKIVAENQWSDLRRILIEFGIVTSEERDTSGSHKEFLRRRFLTDDVMNGLYRSRDAAPQIQRFWDKIEQEFPARGS